VSLLVARFWPYLAGAALLVAVFIGFKTVYAKLDRTQAALSQSEAKLDVSNASVVKLSDAIRQQNEAIVLLGIEGEKRAAEGRDLILAEVRKGARATEVASALANKPQQGGDQSKTSAVVLQAKDLL
jgi:hypothetical protein